MIPQIIHYCWFGKGKKPDIFNRCISSWKKYLPGWKIIEWNEENTDLTSCSFVKDAFSNKRWAFVSDFVRLIAVYEYGGIYMDTDVELFSSFGKLLECNAFMFFQNHNQINTGLGFGAEKGNPIIKSIIDDYKNLNFSINNLNALACPVRNTEVIKQVIPEFRANNKTQYINGIQFASFDEYCSIAHHYGEFSWRTEEQSNALKYSKKNHKAWKLRRILRKPTIFDFFEKYRLKRIGKLYSFFVYDLIDYGIIYWIMKIYRKIRNN